MSTLTLKKPSQRKRVEEQLGQLQLQLDNPAKAHKPNHAPQKPWPGQTRGTDAKKVARNRSFTAERKRALQWLQETFPAVFGKPLKPLKTGVHKDILPQLPAGISADVMGVALKYHVRCQAYLKALATDTHRYALDGSPVEEILDGHRQGAIAGLTHKKPAGAQRAKSNATTGA